MPYFLDGNNLIGRASGRGRPSREDREALIRELLDRLRRTRAKAVLFFDGPAPVGARSLGSLSLRSAEGRSADAAILEEISRSRAPRDIVLVTADRELARRARDAGAGALAPEEFWSRFGGSGGRSERESPAVDVAEWMRYFEDDRNRGER